ncbi:MAG: hypothetical protein IJW46_03070 [Clostridia bacterium]|nr:hypothetical protein [Clostridia bacterium]
MVKKLFKYEFRSYLRTLIPVNLILLAIALMGRIVQFFESDSIAYGLVFGSSVFMLCAAIIVAYLLTVIMVVVRFYKNLFTSEGYLSFTLPVTPVQHILTKLLTAVLFQVITTAAVFLSLMIMTSGELLVEIFKAAGYLFADLFSEVMGWHLVLFIPEYLLALVIGVAYQFLLYYACISLGQRANKNRVLMAVVCYFAYYMIVQVLSTVLMVLLTVIELDFSFLETFFESLGLGALHILIWFYLIASAGLCTLWFFITHKTIKTRLNLE